MNQNVLKAKQESVKAIGESVAASASVTVVSYQGLTVAEMQELRRSLEKEGATMTVYKNTLVRRALADNSQPDLGELLNGTNAFVFSKELSKGPKVLSKFSRYHEALVIKGGLAEGRVVDAKEMKAIAKLPDKNGLLSMFLQCLQAPLTNFAATVQSLADSKAPATDAPAAN